MKYTTIKLAEFPMVLKKLFENPTMCRLNATPPEDGTVLIAPGNGNEIKELPDGCEIIDTLHPGGTILVFKDGVTLIAFDRVEPTWRDDLVAMLLQRGLNAKKERNDVTVDGYKVAGYGSGGISGTDLRYCAIHVSMNVDLALIHKVCAKPMQKVPQGLSRYGITRQDVLDALKVE